MKNFFYCLTLIIVTTLFSCNNGSNADSHTDSVANQIGPVNSPVRPNDNSNAFPNGNEGNSGALDTARTDSLVGPDTVNAH